MLTAEEQWKIIQKECRRTGRGQKHKTMKGAAEEMGCFDVSEERIIREELAAPDTRPPFQYPPYSSAEKGLSRGDFGFMESLRKYFNAWAFQAESPDSWIKPEHLPKYFRFAMRRPFMSKMAFQIAMRDFDIHLDLGMEYKRLERTHTVGRSRELRFGLDLDHSKQHVSHRLKNLLPVGGDLSNGEENEIVEEEAAQLRRDDERNREQDLRQRLWTVYENVNNGHIDLKEAPQYYCNAFQHHHMDNYVLIIWLQQFGLPVDHISTDERSAYRGTTQSPFSASKDELKEDPTTDSFDDKRCKKIIGELVNYIGLYRFGAYTEDEVVPMLKDCLVGLKLDDEIIGDILTDFNIEAEQAALLMWEDACDSSSLSSGNCETSSSATDENEAPNQDQEFIEGKAHVPQDFEAEGHVATSQDSQAAFRSSVSFSVQGNQTSDRAESEDAHREGFTSIQSVAHPESTDIPPASTGPLASAGQTRTSTRNSNLESRTQRSGTPMPKSTSSIPPTRGCSSRHSNHVDLHGTVANINELRRPSSPINGMTNDIWGLLMPTREAREIASHALKLPRDCVQNIRSITPRRLKARRASLARETVTFPKTKRKASLVIQGDSPLKSPKRQDHSDLFARDGEDQESFVMSHFDVMTISSKRKSGNVCMACLHLPCQCVSGSHDRRDMENRCPRCMQATCVCYRLNETGEANPNKRVSNNARTGKLAKKSSSNQSKHTNPVLGYLSRILHDDDVLASMKELEQLSMCDAILEDVKTVLNHLKQGVQNGEIVNGPGDRDSEALAILNRIVSSSEVLMVHLDGLHDNAGDEDDVGAAVLPTSPERRQRQAEEVAELGSSLLNSHLSSDLDPQTSLLERPIVDSTAKALDRQPDVPLEFICQKSKTSPLPNFTPQSLVDMSSPKSSNDDEIGYGASIHCTTSPTISQTAFSAKEISVNLGYQESSRHPDSSLIRQPNLHLYSNAYIEDTSHSAAKTTPFASTGLEDEELPTALGIELFGATLTRQPKVYLQKNPYLEATDRTDVEATQSPSPIQPMVELPKATSEPPPTPKLGIKKLRTPSNPTVQADLQTQGCFDSLPIWPTQPEMQGAGEVWSKMEPQQALEYAMDDALRQRKSFPFYLEERRAVRARIKQEKEEADSILLNDRFFQTPNASSGATVSASLNKIFDTYRGMSAAPPFQASTDMLTVCLPDHVAEDPDKIGVEGSMRYFEDLGVSLEEVVVLAVHAELGAPTMGELTRDGFVSGWTSNRYVGDKVLKCIVTLTNDAFFLL